MKRIFIIVPIIVLIFTVFIYLYVNKIGIFADINVIWLSIMLYIAVFAVILMVVFLIMRYVRKNIKKQ